MEAKVKISFRDKYTHDLHLAGEIIEVSEERYEEIEKVREGIFGAIGASSRRNTGRGSGGNARSRALYQKRAEENERRRTEKACGRKRRKRRR